MTLYRVHIKLIPLSYSWHLYLCYCLPSRLILRLPLTGELVTQDWVFDTLITKRPRPHDPRPNDPAIWYKERICLFIVDRIMFGISVCKQRFNCAAILTAQTLFDIKFRYMECQFNNFIQCNFVLMPPKKLAPKCPTNAAILLQYCSTILFLLQQC